MSQCREREREEYRHEYGQRRARNFIAHFLKTFYVRTKGARSCQPCQLRRSVCVQMGLVKVAGRAGRAGESVELCNKEVVQSPSHRGRLAIQGRARFSTRSKVPTTQMLSWVASSPIRIPSRETTPALPDSESYLVPFSVCRGWRHL